MTRPVDGGGDAIAGLLGGSVEVYTGDISEMLPHLDAGTMRVLAVLSDERLDPPFDQLPTAIEQGYDVSWTILRGFYMGKDAPDEAFKEWQTAFESAYETDEFLQLQKSRGLIPMNLTSEELQKKITEQTAQLTEIASEAGLIQNQ